MVDCYLTHRLYYFVVHYKAVNGNWLSSSIDLGWASYLSANYPYLVRSEVEL